ncbi:short-chain dehydrogenase/reductase [Bordetella genomosp. 10]|uniref:Short-chain dehydrogenase/reductase n=1 Tax=Bordetella genomosp. 10 TaxID=1416804 RepID=A0A261SL54_9BORD|nr:SDR family oxidoreductase [Bordetella genomosp. 10]OZI38136.1 short-chain dehydrogenase/reductase [Bordetella genomosp. 10]
MTVRTWFITGVNRGFGRLMTEQLLERGDRVAGTARKMDSLIDLKERYGEQLWLHSLDLTDTLAIRGVVDAAFAHFGRIDVVVNNAGYGLFGAAEEVLEEQIAHQISTNLVGSIQVVRTVVPHLRSQGGGRILQISSMGGQIALPGLSLYHATKWGIEGFFESTIQDIAPFNIQVTLVEPGSARTNFAFASAVMPKAVSAYDQTPAGDTRRIIEGGGYQPKVDPEKVVREILASVEREPAPKRLVLGVDAYTLISEALKDRLAALEAQKDIALSVDFDD